MAPDAELFFENDDSTLVSMGQAVDWLLLQNADIYQQLDLWAW